MTIIPSRREFLKKTSAIAAGTAGGVRAASAADSGSLLFDERVNLNGTWQFRLDAGASGEKNNWQRPDDVSPDWRPVEVPHTWQIDPATADYMGVAWYRREFRIPGEWSGSALRIEFEAVFHSARIWVNGSFAGEHSGKGYTAFTVDITRLVRHGANTIVVRVDNAFRDDMLPRGRSSDWTHDGGIYRPVTLLVTPKVFIERVDVDAVPDLARKAASLNIVVTVRNSADSPAAVGLGYEVIDTRTGLTVAEVYAAQNADIPAATLRTIPLPESGFRDAQFWHFDHPHLYKLIVSIRQDGRPLHRYETSFGVRSFEVRDGGFYLNGERVRLMGVERMAGSNPAFGMAEPPEWIEHDHDDLKKLNCVFTRVHWAQDRRVLDYCDRHGILIQSEVPTWGGDTFRGMDREPSATILQNGIDQLTEMIQRDRNHPCVFAWGLCNEIGGQNPAAYEFARRMYEHAKKMDPRRLRSYASNSLETTPARDVAGLMDFIEWNEYYETWYPGTPETMRRNLEEIHRAFPDKPIVISEYGYCACTADRPEGDARRVEILRAHDAVFRETSYTGGLIFFCYNDYRTHQGDKGTGVTKQRVHGVVDIYGGRKPSYEVLRREASPVAALDVKGAPAAFEVTVTTRNTVPCYTLEGYKIRAILYGAGEIPLEQLEAGLPRLEPGAQETLKLGFKEAKLALRVRFDVLRPTGYPTDSIDWTA